jgi:hypothetical protein
MKLLTWILRLIGVIVFILVMIIGGLFQFVGDSLIYIGYRLMKAIEGLDEEY